MPDWLSIHEPVLVNTIGHCAGAVIFGMLLYFFLVNRRRAGDERSSLPAMAAVLEIEELRLGPKLQTKVDADPTALRVTIPLLSIQPLVENAVKHGVASRMGAGFVHLKIRMDGETVSVEVSNSGMWDRSPGLSS